ncbi:transporter substrate-binding domain-containing protein [Shewanella sp. CG12_big_fil_rev_8_21_14_0_65_47_15]|uniref:substrate-binding periplasmic protein n=1 Tax=Shewanella sp. CG12_big_fil_rev_8_21_14_0_65_47_15 TaxID=1975537 RepID=UPI000CAAEC22|nr:transporter substrate-binding domain-containing protein [Shewanella sp. CG12_big_fil_rev_8_21_14_0_65_47_15]PIW59275.1 MAG: ABC transporter substrate-binding protein [Shewanella sp. CG12_big_fil_rev_8_21_14_0_65_47_15]
MRLCTFYRLLFCLILNSCVSITAFAQTQITPKPLIRVGGYQFAPYVNLQMDGRYTGLTLDLINALNQIQQQITFEFVPTSIEHRHKAYAAERFDMMLFEDPSWGWEQTNMQFIPLNIKDGEVFIALKHRAKDQLFFADLTDKSMVLVKGYHYTFIGAETDKMPLKKHLEPVFVASNKASIETIFRQRADIAPVTLSYLNYYLTLNPEEKDKLLISKQWAQHYHLGVLLTPHSTLKIDQLKHWLGLLEQSGKLATLAQDYGFTLPVTKP